MRKENIRNTDKLLCSFHSKRYTITYKITEFKSFWFCCN